MSTTDGAGSDGSQEPESPSGSPKWVAGTQVLEPSSAASPATLAGYWIGIPTIWGLNSLQYGL